MAEDAAVDWLGRPVRCADCPHQDLKVLGRCALARTCVLDRHVRRIDRFFQANPELAAAHLGHPYFEVRAMAARHANVFGLPPMLGDTDPAVRAIVVQRLPASRVLGLREDPEAEVRIAVAGRLSGAELLPLLSDQDHRVRLAATRRLETGTLPVMMHDPEPMVGDEDVRVRFAAAERIGHEGLSRLAGDPVAEVRELARERLAQTHARKETDDA